MRSISKKQKKWLCVIVLVVISLIAGFFCMYSTAEKKDTKVIHKENIEKEAQSGNLGSEVIEAQIQSYLEDYLMTVDDGNFLSDEDVEYIVARMSTGILNTVPRSFTTQEQMEIRALAADSLHGYLANNENSTTYDASNDMALNNYIDKTVVPHTAALIQIKNGEINDLKDSLTASSTAYSQDKEYYNALINSIRNQLEQTASDSSVDRKKLEDDIGSLSSVFDGYKSNTAYAIFSINDEMESAQIAIKTLQRLETKDSSNISSNLARIQAVQSDLESEMESQLSGVKENLETQIAENAELSENQKQLLLTQISNLSLEQTQNVEKINGTLDDVRTDYKNADQAILLQLNTLSNQLSNLLDEAHPVGSLYLSTSDQNPAEFLGGQWEAYAQGRTLIGAGTGTDNNGVSMDFTAESDGGEYMHTLSAVEMPNHSHLVPGGTYTTSTNGNHQHSGTTDGAGNHTHAYTNAENASISTIGVDTYITGTAISSINFVTNGSNTSESGWHAHNFTTNAAGNHNHNVTIPDKNTSASGESQAHNNVQPYITVYIWRRVA